MNPGNVECEDGRWMEAADNRPLWQGGLWYNSTGYVASYYATI
jgi:hypothetical protein